MILLVDAGNSRIKWACLIGGVLQSGEAVSREAGVDADVRTLSLAWEPLPRPERVVVASVLGTDFCGRLSATTIDQWNVPTEFIAARAEACGVVNGYRTPERLGADRWAALIGARHLTRAPACVVDCGTAVTIDSLDAQGRHLGGVILPGPRLMARALTEGTQGVRPDAREAAFVPFATETSEGVANGARYAVVAAVDRVIRDIRRTLGRRLHAIVTGGDSEQLLPLLAGRFDHQPELVLKGLAVLAEENR